MVLSKVRFLSIVGAKLRTEVVAVRRPPKFKITIAETERLVAEHAAVADDEISAAQILPRANHSNTNCSVRLGGIGVFW